MSEAGSPGEPTDPLEHLFPFQVEGVRALLSHEALLLADDMGLGKTIQAIAALRALKASGGTLPALIVVPAGLISQWRAELYRWAPELSFSTVRGPASDRSWQWRTPVDAYLVSYETLRSDYSPNPHSRAGQTWGVVILDEAQRIKNRESDVAQVCKALRRERAWALTGTPLENDLDDVASILEFVRPQLETEPAPISASDVAGLRARLATVQLRRRKEEVLTELPEKMLVSVVLELSPAQRRAYDRAEKDGVVQLRALGEKLTITHVLELIMRLKQICNFCPETGASAKFDDLRERLGSIAAEGNRALVFSQFVQEPFGIREIASRLHDLHPLLYEGGISAAQREAVIDRFKRDDRHAVLLLSLKAGGTGLNLQEASYVFHFDRWWNPATSRQAEDRVHRMGQSRAVTVYSYICAGTIEERIEQILSEKQLLFDDMIDNVSLNEPGRLSSEEIFGLFGLETVQQA